MLKVIWILLFFALFVPVSIAQLQEQNRANCELIAKHYAKEYNTEIYFLAFLQDNGARVTGQKYSGHFINSKIIHGQRYFFEFGGVGDVILSSEQEVKDWYFSKTATHIELYDSKNTPFQIIWLYPD